MKDPPLVGRAPARRALKPWELETRKEELERHAREFGEIETINALSRAEALAFLPKLHWVYAILEVAGWPELAAWRDGDRHPLEWSFAKIGYSKKPLKRLSALQHANPRPLLLAAVLRCPSLEAARDQEIQRHHEIEGSCVGGEWFLRTGDTKAIVADMREATLPEDLGGFRTEHREGRPYEPNNYFRGAYRSHVAVTEERSLF